ncbi:hypothetical protein ACJX0J_028933, partial [Zea mays]
MKNIHYLQDGLKRGPAHPTWKGNNNLALFPLTVMDFSLEKKKRTESVSNIIDVIPKHLPNVFWFTTLYAGRALRASFASALGLD